MARKRHHRTCRYFGPHVAPTRRIQPLNNLSLSIQPGKCIRICGRSGSGMSSTTRSIHIDGLDISNIPHMGPSTPERLPTRTLLPCKYVPMQTRPFRDGLGCSIGGLDVEMSVDMLSAGQRQLFTLGRALLRPRRIVVLHEATSSVDHETYVLIQRLVW